MARMIPSRQAPDLLAGQWRLLSQLGRAPKALVWDNETAIGQWRGGRPQLTAAMNAFRGTLGIKRARDRGAWAGYTPLGGRNPAYQAAPVDNATV